MGLKTFVAKRIARMVLTLFIIVTMNFFLFRAIPGEPHGMIIAPQITPEMRERLLEVFGLREPLYMQYFKYVVNMFRGEFGISFYYLQPVSNIIMDMLWNTLTLMGASFGLAYALGTVMGIFLAWRRGTWKETSGLVFTLIFCALPIPWTGMIALMVFGFRLGWLPLGGIRSTGAEYASIFEKFFSLDFLYHLALPVITYTLYIIALPMLIMRSSFLEVMGEDFVEVAKAKGLKERIILTRHIARNALLPVVTAFAVDVGMAFGGQVIVEHVFNWPGIGREMFQAIIRNDYPMAQATFFMMAVVIIVMNFVADILYGILDPRVTYD